MTLDSVKSYTSHLTKMHGRRNGLAAAPSLFLRLASYLFVRPEIFIGISRNQPCEACQQEGDDPFYDGDHVVLHFVRILPSSVLQIISTSFLLQENDASCT